MVFIPVKSVTVADPPRISIELTMMLVERLFKQVNNDYYLSLEATDYPKNKKTRWANFPHLTLIISSHVCA